MERITDFLGHIREKGVKLWSENGRLHFKAPKGTLTQEEIERLKVLREQIVALMESATVSEAAEPRFERRPQADRAPLTFSQLAHWNVYQLGERCSLRQIASATRLRGRLNVDLLRKSFADIIRRHDSLRTRITVVDGVPTQEIAESDDFELRIDDLTTLSESLREVEVKRIIDKFILQPINVAVDPLLGSRLVRLRDDEHVLIVAMEHMISDASSMNILLRDLFTAYAQAVKGRAFSLPAMPVQFADYAVWQRNGLSSWLETHGTYWSNRLSGRQRVRFPADRGLSAGTRPGWGRIPVQIGMPLKAELRHWCRLRRTTLAMGVLTAYIALLLRWCDVSEIIIQYVTDGRISRKLENAIGYFAGTLFLRVELREDDDFVDLMNRVTEEYCNAYEHADSCYMEAQLPRPEFARNSAFNWLRGPKIDLSELDDSEDAITCCPVPFEHPMLKIHERDNEPLIMLWDTEDDIVGDVCFSLALFSTETMERFKCNFLEFIRALLNQKDQRVKDVLLL